MLDSMRSSSDNHLAWCKKARDNQFRDYGTRPTRELRPVTLTCMVATRRSLILGRERMERRERIKCAELGTLALQDITV